jgi:hypothetical protein
MGCGGAGDVQTKETTPKKRLIKKGGTMPPFCLDDVSIFSAVVFCYLCWVDLTRTKQYAIFYLFVV